MTNIFFYKSLQLVANCIAFFSASPTQAKPTSHLSNTFTDAEIALVWKILVVLFQQKLYKIILY